jgi:uncharacterized membrane protein YcfT
MSIPENTTRFAWVDCAKGICIILVILMHANGGVEKLTGQLTFIDAFIQWAKPFRMPGFFLISGLFLAGRINAPWPKYLDSKVLHFAYFYVLWAIIQHAFKDLTRGETIYEGLSHYLTFLVEPTPTLWFLYMLAIFFVVAKITLPLPRFLVFALAALLEAMPIETGSIIIDEFCRRFVYFYAGYWFAGHVFGFASRAAVARTSALFLALTVWAAANAGFVMSGFAAMPGLSLILGFAGTAALISVSVFCAKGGGIGALRYCGEHSIVIYLAFTLFMGPARVVLFAVAPDLEPALVSLVSTLSGVIGPLALHWLTKDTVFASLFDRPFWARLENLWQRPPKDSIASARSDSHSLVALKR